jgi:2-polyprenyl-6-methoxyphenol hydroxylase-like FAD-dependent oxidoreductase
MSTSVLIIGAGPVGLTMALELARFQVPVRIIDKSAARTDKSKALAVWSRTLELLDRSGVASSLIEAGLKMRAVDIMSGKNTIARVPFDKLASKFPFVLMVPQSETERVLEEKLASLGVKVERNVEFQDFVDSGSEVSCNLTHPDGRDETVVDGWLIGSDGAHSQIRHRLGMAFDGDTVPGTYVLADVHVAGLDLPEDEFPIFWHRDGMVAFFPIDKNRYRVIADLGAGELRDPKLANVQAIVEQRGPGGVVLSDSVWIAPFAINERKVKDFRAGRVFLAGDAAHIHSPAGGQGMNTGIQDAMNLAWKLAMVVTKKADEDFLLDSYSAERSENAARVLRDSGRMLRVATMPNAAAQAVRDFLVHRLLGFSSVSTIAAQQLSELAVGYDHSPLNGGELRGSGFPRPGHRMPADFAFGASSSVSFTLIVGEGVNVNTRHQGLRDILEIHNGNTGLVDGLCLVRPDGYVAMTTDANGWDDIVSYLDRILQKDVR